MMALHGAWQPFAATISLPLPQHTRAYPTHIESTNCAGTPGADRANLAALAALAAPS